MDNCLHECLDKCWNQNISHALVIPKICLGMFEDICLPIRCISLDMCGNIVARVSMSKEIPHSASYEINKHLSLLMNIIIVPRARQESAWVLLLY